MRSGSGCTYVYKFLNHTIYTPEAKRDSEKTCLTLPFSAPHYPIVKRLNVKRFSIYTGGPRGKASKFPLHQRDRIFHGTGIRARIGENRDYLWDKFYRANLERDA